MFTQLEVESGITSPGGGSRGVCCDPIKKADRLWHPLQKTRGLHLPKYPCIRAQKAGQIPTKPPLNLLRGANGSLSKLLIADCSGRVQVDLLSGLQPSFHSIQVSSQTQTCLHTSLSSPSPASFTSSSSGPVQKPKITHARFSATSVSVGV